MKCMRCGETVTYDEIVYQRICQSCWSNYSKKVKQEREINVIKTEQEVVNFLIDRLHKECENGVGYLGVEYDNPDPKLEEGITLTVDLFDKIMREMLILTWNSDDYIQDEENRSLLRNQASINRVIKQSFV